MKDIMTFKEASELWKLGESTLRSTIRTNKLVEGIDCWKSGSVWLIKKEAMIRVYGYIEENRKIDTKNLALLFSKIKSKYNKENDYLFSQIKFELQHIDTEIFKEDDIKALCCMTVLKKCKWLSCENYNDFVNVNSFIELFLQEIKKETSVRVNNGKFEKLTSIIIKLSEL